MNLATLAVLMNSNAPMEKKSPELTGSRSNNAFAALLANTVNDSTVLYTNNKTKIMPAIAGLPAVGDNKTDSVGNLNKDSTAIVKKLSSLPVRDTEQFIAKISPPKPSLDAPKDSGDAAKNTVSGGITHSNSENKLSEQVVADSAKKAMDAINQANALIKTMAPGADSLVAVKKKSVVTDTVLAKQTEPKSTDPTTLVKLKQPVSNENIIAQHIVKSNGGKYDSTALAPKKPAVKLDSTAIARTEKIKDSNLETANSKKLLVSGKDTEHNNPVLPKTDSTAIVKKDIPLKKSAKPAVSKAAELATDSGYVAIFIDASKENSDTIRVQIPIRKPVLVAKKETPIPMREITLADSIAKKPAKDSSVLVQVPKKEEPMVKPLPVAPADTSTAKKSSIAIPNSDCKDVAWDSDIDKLRIKMLLLRTTEEKIALAKKTFVLKCFLTKQVKALSELFATDEGKYQWCDAVYPFVADSNNFPSLSELFKEVYYLNRFKAMIRN